MVHGFGISMDEMKANDLATTLKKIGYNALTLGGNTVIAGNNRETILIEVEDDTYAVKFGYNDSDVLRTKTIKRKQIKSVINQIIAGFDEADELRNYYTKQWLKGEALFHDAKWLSATYFKKASV